MNIKYAQWTKSEIERALDQALAQRDAAVERAEKAETTEQHWYESALTNQARLDALIARLEWIEENKYTSQDLRDAIATAKEVK